MPDPNATVSFHFIESVHDDVVPTLSTLDQKHNLLAYILQDTFDILNTEMTV